ncbi:MAG TPA: CbtB domain-containing protein [Acidimicrobiales bacterium]|jgi:hypothetical protein
MSDAFVLTRGAKTVTRPAPVVIPVREILPWAVFIGVLALALLYVVGCEQGATSFIGGHMIHEWVHDSRHLLGFPCH